MAGVGELRGGRAGRGLVPLTSTRSGAVTQDVPFQFDPTLNGAYRGAMRGGGFASVQVISPIAAVPADLDIQAGGVGYFLAGGGNSINIPGPVWGVKATPRGAAVSGVGADQITFAPVGRY